MNISTDLLTPYLNDQGIYECVFLKHKFAHRFLNEQINPLGDIITFIAPIQLGSLYLKKSIVIAWELPNSDMKYGICFSRLFASQIGSLISTKFDKDIYSFEGLIFQDEKQSSISVNLTQKGSVLSHIFIPQEVDDEQLGTFTFAVEEEKQILDTIEKDFYYLTKNIFLESSRDNF